MQYNHTVHHNVIAHNNDRNPKLDRVLADVRNNIIYNIVYGNVS